MGSFNRISRISASARFCTTKRFFCTTKTVCVPESVSVPESRSVSVPPRILPWLMLPPSPGGSYNFYCLAEDRVININKKKEIQTSESEVVGSSHGWLAYYNKMGDGELFLSDPLSGRHIQLPRIDALPGAIPVYSPGRARLKKLILSHPPDHQDCIAMAMYGYGDFLAFCRPGRGTGWTRIGGVAYVNENGDMFGRQYEEMIYSSSLNLFFCVTMNNTDFEAWDLSKSQPALVWTANWRDMEKLSESESEDEDEDNFNIFQAAAETYLVYEEEANQLYMVIRYVKHAVGPDGLYVKDFSPLKSSIDLDVGDNWEQGRSISLNRDYPQKTILFEVRRLDWEQGKLTYLLRRFNGLSMFIGTNHSMAVAAAPELKPDSIYFTHVTASIPHDHNPDYKYGGHDIGVFYYPERTISPCYYPCDAKSMKRIIPAPLWFTPSTPLS